jgi:AraC-like DNA-binding protein
MAAAECVSAASVPFEYFPDAELTALIEDANTSFDANRLKAKLCIQRALRLIQREPVPGIPSVDLPCVSGGLAVWQMKQLSTYIETNMAAKIRVPQLASLVHLSAGHFFRAFKASFGACPQDYLMRKRISRAAALMSTSTHSLAHIAFEVGLCDQAHFSRTFRRMTGVSPNSWRRQCGGDQLSQVTSTGSRSVRSGSNSVSIMPAQNM